MKTSLSDHDYVRRLVEDLSQAADSFRAVPMKRYMRDQFDFFGIPTPQRNAILRAHVMQHGQPQDVREVAGNLWQHDERECQYAACTLLAKNVKTLELDDVPFVESLITTKSWWDTVDTLAPNIAGAIALKHQRTRAIAEQWIESDNFWLQRSAILLQLKYKAHTDEALLFQLIERRASSTEFFVRKAAGWALRQYAYTSPQHVQQFVDKHRSQLSGLTIREALKHYPTVDTPISKE